jgi:hypothetical protein
MEETMSDPFNPLILTSSAERLMIWRIENNVSISTNGRALAISLEQATALRDGLIAVLGGEFDRAATPDMLASPRAASARPAPTPDKRPNAVPNLEDI